MLTLPEHATLRRAGLGSLLAASLITVVLAVTYGLYAYPHQDDFCFMLTADSPIATANFYYQHWSGRWLAMYFYELITGGYDYVGRGVGPLVVWSIPLWFGAFYLIVSTAMRPSKVRERLFVTLVLFAVFWSSAPGIADLFFWVAGFFCYPVPFYLSALSISLLARDHARPWQVALAVTAAFLAPSFNELAGIVLASVLFFLLLHRWRISGSRLPFAAALIATLIGTAIVLLAPGTGVRIDQQPSAGVSIATYVSRLFRPYDSVFAQAFDPRLLALLLAASCSGLLGKSKSGKSAVLILFAAFGAATAGNAAFVLATGSVPSYRVLGYCFAALLGGAALAAWHLRGRIESKGLELASLVALAGLIATAPNVTMAIHDLPRLNGWSASQQALWASLQGRQGQAVAVTDLPYYPSLFFVRQVHPDPSDAFNRCLADRFDLRSIRSIGPAGQRWRTY